MLTDNDWNKLLERIRDGKCTPFLGAGACYGYLPLGTDVAYRWARQLAYPFRGRSDLPKVAQYYATQAPDMLSPKEEIAREIETATAPDFKNLDEPHGLMADLPLPIYVTTNYDGFLAQALRSRHREPDVEICRWNAFLKRRLPSVFERQGYTPTAANPLVFHLHGHFSIPQSLVLTEDDYLDFLVSINRDNTLLPARLDEAFTGTTLLFIGYSLQDLTFRVLFRMLIYGISISWQPLNISVQLPPQHRNPTYKQRAEEFLRQYFSRNMNVKIYWGTAREFTTELRARWEAFRRAA